MENILQDIGPDIDSLLESVKEFFSASEDVVGDAAIEIYIILIPKIRDQLYFDPDGALNYLEKYKEEHRRKYSDAEKNSTNHTPKFDVYSFSRSQDDKFFHGVLIKVSDLIVSKIRSSKAKGNVSTGETTNTPEKPNVNISAKHYVLAYVYDKLTSGEFENIPRGTSTGIHEIGRQIGGDYADNTFYKNYNRIIFMTDVFNNLSKLEEQFGEHWREIVQYIFNTKNSESKQTFTNSWTEVDEWLTNHGL